MQSGYLPNPTAIDRGPEKQNVPYNFHLEPAISSTAAASYSGWPSKCSEYPVGKTVSPKAFSRLLLGSQYMHGEL
jgi:hypothetical protein